MAERHRPTIEGCPDRTGRRDLAEWKSILEEADVNDHVVMEIMGWSPPTMKQRYMHATEQLRTEVINNINGYFWKAQEDRSCAPCATTEPLATNL